jgi:hypothetical protein
LVFVGLTAMDGSVKLPVDESTLRMNPEPDGFLCLLCR